MDVIEDYVNRLTLKGNTQRDIILNRYQNYLSKKIPNSLSYKKTKILVDGTEQNVVITNTKDFSEKFIMTLPGETLIHGALIEWEDNVWLITEVDAHDEVYTKGKLKQCNHLLKWRDDTGAIIEKWSIVEDGTKYLIGEKQKEVMTIGDARIAVTVPKDDDTIKLGRGRRFLIDDVDTETVSAYQITKLNRMYNIYNNKGIFRYILGECNTSPRDNLELRIADYYPPIINTNSDSYPDVVDDDDNKKVWI